jgi:hypothetical protein
MGREGGLYYLFGQVNAVPAAFNAGSLKPLKRFHFAMERLCPEDLVPFVMLSTHDGRSVQGLGVHRSDGHLSIEEFYELKSTVEERGGRVKYRAVPRGSIPADTLRKVCTEARVDEEKIRRLFESGDDGDTLRLLSGPAARPRLLMALADAAGRDAADLADVPAVDFALEWISEGKTPYELCCTTRSSFRRTGSDGKPLDADTEARRLALAHLYLLSSGQGVPGVYFNDLLGLENDIPGHDLSGKPRDLNRHKSYLPDAELEEPSEPFYAAYRKLLNRALDVRAADPAFYPGSRKFEFRALSDTVFLNHPHARNSHSFILGNISDQLQKLSLEIEGLQGLGREELSRMHRLGLRDRLTEQVHRPESDGTGKLLLRLVLPPYTAVWLKEAG